MFRLLALGVAAALVWGCGQGGRATTSQASRATDPPAPPTRVQGESQAGVASVDASWHFGASAGQFAATGTGIDEARGFDPYFHAVRKVGSDILGSRISVRALVAQGVDGQRIAVVANDLYLPNDFLRRRVAQLLAQEAGLGIGIDNLAMTASHSHTSPFYSTPAVGVWIFQDVYDIRFYEYMAQRMRDAIVAAAQNLRPARVGGAAFYANDIRSHTYGPKVATDGTPAGQPHDYTTRQAYVLQFDDVVTGQPFANWVVLGVHPEWVWGEEIMNGDVSHSIMRLLDRETGAITVMSQSETGTSGPHKDERAHPASARREFQESNQAGSERAARLFVDNVHDALARIDANDPWDPTQFVPMQGGFAVDFAHQRFAPPASRPYPGLSNCNSDRLYYEANPGVPILGFPDCQFPLEPVVEPFETMSPVAPSDVTGPLADQLLGLGVPLPHSYSAPFLLLLEEQATVPIQAFRIGDIAITFCPCEQFTDTALNIISRVNRVQDDLHTGWDWDIGYQDDLRPPKVDHSASTGCVQTGDDEWTCPHPNRFNASSLVIDGTAYRRMKAQIHNDAAGWDDAANVLHAESEPLDPALIKGNFTHEELGEFGYGLVVPVGMANDYWGYMPAYREYRAHDHYRKALAGLGPHGADFLATRLSRLAASLQGHPGQPATALDLVFTLESTRAETLAQALGSAAQVALPLYEATLPRDGGSPQILEQPRSIGRFDGTHLRFVGGSSYEGMPQVQVERRTPAGWVLAGTQDGEVQLHVQFPAANQLIAQEGGFAVPALPDLIAWRSGQFEWEWVAGFEAFASELALPDPGAGQRPDRPYLTPAGEYRFVVSGRHRGADGVAEYELVSESFEVLNTAPITADAMRRQGQSLYFDLGPRSEHTVFQRGIDPVETVEVSPRVVGPIDYPDSYESPIPWVRAQRNLHSYQEGEADDQVYCHRCSFRPWLDVGEIASVCARLQRGGQLLERSCDAHSADGQAWEVRFRSALNPADQITIAPGDLSDQLGQHNAQAFELTLTH